MRPLPDTPVFDRAEARAAGWSDSALTRAVRSGRVRQVRRGLFAATDAGHVQAVAAARAVCGAAVSHRSGLLLRELPVVGARPALPEITVPPSGTGDAHAALLHRATLLDTDLEIVDGVLTTSVARTLIDVARSRPTTTAVAAIDAALNRELTTLDQLDDILVRCWNWPGIRRAHRAVGLVDGRSESPLESISRLVLAAVGLPRPAIQPWLLDQHGRVVARLDFYWDEFGVAGEADGRAKYDGREVLTAEKDRQEGIENLGVAVTRWGWELAWRRPRALKARIELALGRGAARDRSGLPRLWSIAASKPVRPGEKVISSAADRSDQGRT